MSILTVTPNPALDLTYNVDRLRAGEVHRVSTVRSRPGGKGINVARVAHTLGVQVSVTGLAGGPEGAELQTALAELGIDDALVTTDISTRRTVTIVDGSTGEATLLNEPGPAVTATQWGLLRRRVLELSNAAARVVVISGSLPPGIEAGMLGELVHAISTAGVPVVVDSSGESLWAAVRAGATVVKPNAQELMAATGVSDVRHGALALRGTGDCSVIASLGPDGLLAVTGAGSWTARLPAPLSGNPTGAGDSAVAALAAGLSAGRTWPEMLRDACALSAATVLAPVAGEYDADVYTRLRSAVHIQEVSE
jgi:tagatose 6-phosphate kinase